MSETRQRIALQPAYLLHHYPYRDSSRLLELITRDYGRVGLVARGARSRRSAWRSVLQPFSALLVSWTGRGELGTLTGAEMCGSAMQLPGDRVYSGWYLNELLLRLTRRFDVHEALFADYANALQQLAAEQQNEARALRIFEKRLLETLGYGIDLGRTLSGDAVAAGRRYEYRLEQGIFEADDSFDQSLVFDGQSLLSLADETLGDGRELADARRLLQAALAIYLGPRPLKVREVRRAVYRHRG